MRALALPSSEAANPLKQFGPKAQPVPVAPLFPKSASINSSFIQRKAGCACGGDCPTCAAEETTPGGIQTKLQLSSPGDQYEQEADRVADQVMRVPDPVVQRQCKGCSDSPASTPTGDEPPRIQLQTNGAAGAREVTSEFTSRLGAGTPLDAASRRYFEPRFGQDFGDVRIHHDAQAAAAAAGVQARAFTLGHDVVFAGGEHNPSSESGRRLLAHELTHVVQQSAGTRAMLQRQHVAPTGFSYTLRPAVTRSIIEIQGIVGSTPDGVYAEDTRRAVVKYQTKLKAVGLLTGAVDGLWGEETDLAHEAFAKSSTTERKSYNCAGFAFKTYGDVDLPATKAEYAKMTKLVDCTKPCSPYYHKFWMWEFDIKLRTRATGVSGPTWHDFHTVGGQTDASGNGPDQVMSKDGQRPVVGPKPPLDFKPKPIERALNQENVPSPDKDWVTSNMTEACYCSDKLP